MYNGIGLATARGTATNGYVQKNVAYRRKDDVRRTHETPELPKMRKPNQAILDHQRKRAVELRLVEWAEEEKIFDKHSEEEAESLLAEKRKEFTELQERGLLEDDSRKTKETHQSSVQKEKEMERFRQAMHIRKDYETGNAFKEGYQEEMKNKRYEENLEREKQKFLAQKERQEEQRQRRMQQVDDRDRRGPPPRRGRRNYSPDRRDRRSVSPRDRSYRRRSISRSPPRKRYRRSRSPSQSISPPRRRSSYRSSSPGSRSPSLSPVPRRRSTRSPRRSRSPPSSSSSRSPSPALAERRRKAPRSLSRSPSTNRE